jgi:ubiquinone/menaquinone biosynthesis C-methylase UbiE
MGNVWRFRLENDRHPARRQARRHIRPVSTEYQSLDVAEEYDRRRFHSLGGRYNNWRLQRLLRSALGALAPGSAVLDIPCGTGRIDDRLLRRSLRVIAADISTAMLTVAQRKLRPRRRGLAFVRADAGCLPFRSHSVPAVLCVRFLHLMDPTERRAVLTELARVAKHWVIVEYRNLDPPVRSFKRAILAWFRREDRPRRRTVSDIEAELRRCGLGGRRYYYVNRWFSGSVLVAADHRPRIVQPTTAGAGSRPAQGELVPMGVTP